MKLQILASYNILRIGQDSEFALFWPGIDNVKIDHAFTFGMPKKANFDPSMLHNRPNLLLGPEKNALKFKLHLVYGPYESVKVNTYILHKLRSIL